MQTEQKHLLVVFFSFRLLVVLSDVCEGICWSSVVGICFRLIFFFCIVIMYIYSYNRRDVIEEEEAFVKALGQPCVHSLTRNARCRTSRCRTSRSSSPLPLTPLTLGTTLSDTGGLVDYAMKSDVYSDHHLLIRRRRLCKGRPFKNAFLKR